MPGFWTLCKLCRSSQLGSKFSCIAWNCFRLKGFPVSPSFLDFVFSVVWSKKGCVARFLSCWKERVHALLLFLFFNFLLIYWFSDALPHFLVAYEVKTMSWYFSLSLFFVYESLCKKWRSFGGFIVNFEHISHLYSSVSIVNFDYVIAGWVIRQHTSKYPGWPYYTYIHEITICKFLQLLI